jgi:arylsulfatase A-like enzyme
MEHGMFLYDEQTRIPLIMSFPDLIPENRTINTVIESIDIAPPQQSCPVCNSYIL